MKTQHQKDEAIGHIRGADELLLEAVRLLYAVQQSGDVILSSDEIEKITGRATSIRQYLSIMESYANASLPVFISNAKSVVSFNQLMNV